MTNDQVQPGQLWADHDQRGGLRFVRVVSTDVRFAYCKSWRDREDMGRSTRIDLSSFRPGSWPGAYKTGFRPATSAEERRFPAASDTGEKP